MFFRSHLAHLFCIDSLFLGVLVGGLAELSKTKGLPKRRPVQLVWKSSARPPTKAPHVDSES